VLPDAETCSQFRTGHVVFDGRSWAAARAIS